MNTHRVYTILAIVLLTLLMGLSPMSAARADEETAIAPPAPDNEVLAVTGDPYEPNNRRADATPINYGAVINNATIDPPGDTDFYRFNGTGGDTIVADIDADVLGSYLDSTLALFDASGAQLAYNDDWDGVDSKVTFTLPSNGTYYLRVQEYSHPVAGGPYHYYTLRLTGQGGVGTIYISPRANQTLGGISARQEDILRFNNGSYSMYFDGSDVGVKKGVVGFALLDDGSILMTFRAAVTLPGIGKVLANDIVRFFPTSLGENTAGSFAWFLDASDVGLVGSGESIDAVAVAPDGRLLISTAGAATVSGPGGSVVTAANEDLLAFNATRFGSSSAGTWALYFDGSDVGLATPNVWDAWVHPSNGDVYVTLDIPFTIGGVTGDAADILRCDIGTVGSNTSCTLSMYWDGSSFGVNTQNGIDGFALGTSHLVNAAPLRSKPTN